jgi:cystathionine beta-lyase/cystathionine gamma-synthase
MTSTPFRRLETKLVHAGEPRPRIERAVAMPIFQSATFESSDDKSYHDIRYARLNNTPNHTVLHRKLAALENAEAALVTSSGMAAITTTLLALLRPGDHLLAQSCLYGGTHDFLTRDFLELGFECDFIDPTRPERWREKLRPSTRAVYVEAITNPLMEVIDLEAVVAFAREHGLLSLIDNTFASPVNFRPAEWGFDVSLHSATKYLNGHSDLIAGAVIGRAPLVEKVTHKLNHLGGSLDPHAAFLLHRGLKTLALRVRCQTASALEVARFLERRPEVARVNYPGLESHPGHGRVERLFEGAGGMLSFELHGGASAAEELLRALQLGTVAPSLGGPETLVTRPAATSHLGMKPEDRARLGISDSLIRVSVGFEAVEEIIADFEQALVAARSVVEAASAR